MRELFDFLGSMENLETIGKVIYFSTTALALLVMWGLILVAIYQITIHLLPGELRRMIRFNWLYNWMILTDILKMVRRFQIRLKPPF